MTMPEISVIMPAYNQADYLGDAIRSVLAERSVTLELIVVNDGSTDETAAVAASFNDPRLRVIHQANAGLSGARNRGIRAAAAPLISFLDADDLMLPGGQAILASFLSARPDMGMVSGEHVVIDSSGKERPTASRANTLDDITVIDLLNGNPFAVGTMTVRRTWLDTAGAFDESLAACEDWDLWLRLSQAGCRIAHVNEPVMAYRSHPDQMTQDPARMRTASLAVLDKIASQPHLPTDIREALPQAYARAYLRAAARELHAGQQIQASADIERATSLYPALLENDGAVLITHFAGWAHAPSATDPVQYMRDVFDCLPPSTQHIARHKNRELARLFASSAFRHHQHNETVPAGEMALQAMRHDLSWASNRGVWAIVGRALTARLKEK